MTKRIILISFFTLMLHTAFCQQPLWKISPNVNSYASIGNDTSTTNLKNLLLQDNEIASYAAAAILLAYHYGSTEQNFLLDVLRKNAYKDSINYDGLKYSLYQELRGYLGDQGAIAGMDSIARFARYLDRRLNAIKRLAEAGYYEHFDLVKEAYADNLLRESAEFCLELYGRDPRFVAEAGDLLAVTVRDSMAITPVLMAAGSIAEFDKPRAVALLDQRFRTWQGTDRMLLFGELNSYDPENQPERTVWAVPRELNEVNRSFYFPDYSGVISGFYSKRYLEPWYVKFVVDWLKTETSKLVTVDVFNSFIKVYKPLVPPPSTPVIVMIDSLISYKHQVAQLGWLKDKKEDEKDDDKDKDDTIVRKLDKLLEEARKELVKRDSVEARKEMEEFVKKVEELRKKSIEAEQKQKLDKILLTEEGYKFLFYNAKYILDHLPAKKDDDEKGGKKK